MPWQLIYTSAPRGLVSGQSGFGTVARSADLREALAQRLEQLSYYHYLRIAEAATADRNPTVCAARILDLRGTKYYVLTRIQPCGLDFTARTNHLAHHLIFQANELPQLPSPAAILRHWDGWMSSWQGEPRLIADPSLGDFAAAGKYTLPANAWLRTTGDAGRAAGLLEGECARGCYLVCPNGGEMQVLDLYCESLQLLNLTGQHALRPWRNTFTTFLQAEDNPSDFQWRACQEGTPGYQEAVQRSANLLRLQSIRVPSNSLTKVAREGQKQATLSSLSTGTAAKVVLDKTESAPSSTPASSIPDPWADVDNDSESDGVNTTLSSATMMRLGVFAAVLIALVMVKVLRSPKHAPVTPPPPAATTPPPAPTPATPSPMSLARPPQTAPPDPSQLERLAFPGLIFILVVPNPAQFALPIQSNLKLQALIGKLDKLTLLPKDLRLSMNTDGWDFPSGAPLTVNNRPGESFSGQTAGGTDLTFDYSSWKSDVHSPVTVRASFPTPPHALAMQFEYANPSDGDPFRLLVVNENSSPAPLPLSLRWVRDDREGFRAALQEPLGDQIATNYILPDGWKWQLRPFIATAGGHQAAYLYKDWPIDDLPRDGAELEFATVTQGLTARLQPLREKLTNSSKQIKDAIQKGGFDLPLGEILDLKETKLRSLLAHESDPAPGDFMAYLNILKKRSGAKNEWPKISQDDEETEVSAKLQQIQGWWFNKFPSERTRLSLGASGYFVTVWQELKNLDKIRQEKQHMQDDVDKIQGRLSLVPGGLDKVAHVGLYLVNPSKAAAEMIRFEGP